MITPKLTAKQAKIAKSETGARLARTYLPSYHIIIIIQLQLFASENDLKDTLYKSENQLHGTKRYIYLQIYINDI